MSDATTKGRKNLKPRRVGGAPLTWIQNVDDEASYALRKQCKYHQNNAVRDAQIYSDATLIELDADHNMLIETPGFMSGMGWNPPRRWLIDVEGNRRKCDAVPG